MLEQDPRKFVPQTERVCRRYHSNQSIVLGLKCSSICEAKWWGSDVKFESVNRMRGNVGCGGGNTPEDKANGAGGLNGHVVEHCEIRSHGCACGLSFRANH